MNESRPIRAVTFDIDDTLWDLTLAIRNALEASLEELHVVAETTEHGVDLAHMAALREQVAEELDHLRGTSATWLEDVRRESFRRLVHDLELRDAEQHATRLSEVFFAHRFGNVVLYQGVSETLRTLRDGYRLGVITNGNTSIAATDIADHFGCNVVAAHHGCAKPDRRLFEIACAELACAPEEIVHVGDSLPEDIAGAQAAGLRAVWFNPNGRDNDTGVRPDGEIGRFADLPRLVERGL